MWIIFLKYRIKYFTKIFNAEILYEYCKKKNILKSSNFLDIFIYFIKVSWKIAEMFQVLAMKYFANISEIYHVDTAMPYCLSFLCIIAFLVDTNLK